jgi:hypothetical protein
LKRLSSEDELSGRPLRTAETLVDEEWIVQERLSLMEEYRVHTLEDSVVPDLTRFRHSNRPAGSERKTVEGFVQEVLDSLPNGFVAETCCGWDVARMRDGPYKVVEVNFAGLHPFPPCGFQCSGFMALPPWGPAAFAELLSFVEAKYDVVI